MLFWTNIFSSDRKVLYISKSYLDNIYIYRYVGTYIILTFIVESIKRLML